MSPATPNYPLEHYLATLLGHPVSGAPVAKARLSNLPGYLPQRYKLWQADVLGRELVFATPAAGAPLSPSLLGRDLALLGERLGAPVVVVRGELAAWERGRYVAAGIPFVVPGEQLFLPMLMVDLRDMKRRTAPVVEPRGQLSWAAQVVVLRHLLADDVAGIPLTDLAARLGYSRMTMTNVQREIEAHSLCRVEPAGRAKRLVFPADRAAMWRDAQPLMRSPIRGREFLARCEADLPASGLSALAARTELAGPRVPVVAAPLSAVRKLVELGRLEPTPDPDAEVAELELWHYDPALLSPGDTVDPLSLVLSLQGDADERVEAALVAMLEELPWSRV